MSFSSKWLAVREPIDHAARNAQILSEVNAYFADKSVIKITDIGTGTGSTVRALKNQIQNPVQWHLVDNDVELLEIAKDFTENATTTIEVADLSKSLDALFSQAPDIITTSAFLDLVSQEWLERFVKAVTEKRLPFYAALTYDGRAACQPELVSDQTVVEEFNNHQRTEKGFGPALGPYAADKAIQMFVEAGYNVSHDTSDWLGTPEHADFQKMLLDGWASAAMEMRPDRKHTFTEWLAERYRLIDAHQATVFVGHKDFLAVPK